MAYKLGPTDKKKKTTAFLESRFAQASSTNNSKLNVCKSSGCIKRETTLNFDSDFQIAFDTGFVHAIFIRHCFFIIFLIKDPSLELNHIAM